MRQYPLAIPTLCFAAGVLAGDGFTIPLSLCFLASLTLLALSLAVKKNAWLLTFFLFLAGLTRMELSQSRVSPHDLRTLLGEEPTLATVRGRLIDTPTIRTATRGNRTVTHFTTFLEIETLQLPGQPWRSAFGQVLTLGSGMPIGGLFSDSKVEVTGALGPPAAAETPGAFDYRQYLARTGVFFQLQTSSSADWRLRDTDGVAAAPLCDEFVDWSRKALALGLPRVDTAVELLWAMTLGWKPGLNHEVQEPFMRSGTIHVFAISGLHIALIAAILVECLSLLTVPRGVAAAVAVPIIWIYTGITGWQASAIRSAVMWSVIAAGWVLNRPSNLINSLAGAGGLLLAWDPQQLFLPGFQLSFGVVLSLALFAPKFRAMDPARFLLDPLVPDSHRSRWRVWTCLGARWLWNSLTVSLAAWIGSVPLIAHYFHLFNPVSLLANLVVVPLSSIALASSLASLATAAWCPQAAELFNHSSWLWMQLMLKVSQWAAGLPGGCYYVREPGWMGFSVYYGLIFALLNEKLRRGRLGMWFWTVWLGLVGVAAFVRLEETFVTHLAVLPRRGGAALWVNAANGGKSTLIDPGDSRSVESIIFPFLKSKGVNEIDDLIITQGTVLGGGGVEWLEDRFLIHDRIIPGGNLRSPYLRHWQAESRLHHRSLRVASIGTACAGWEVFYPRPTGKSLRAEEAPLVISFTFSGVRLLWLSNLNAKGQDALMSNTRDLRAQLVIGGIPLRGEPMASPLLDRIQPEVVVITDADYPASSRASEALKRRLRTSRWKTYFSRDCGSLEIWITGGQIHVRPWRDPNPSRHASEDAPVMNDP